MKHLLLATGLAVLLSVFPALAPASAGRTDSNSQTFPGTTAPDANAPDITSVVVSNDDGGTISFKVNIGNRPTFTSDMALLVFLNTDENTATGDPQNYGADYVIQLLPGDAALFQWNGSTYVPAAFQTSLAYLYDATGATIHVSASQLGKTRAFGFLAVAFSGITTDASGNPDFSNAHSNSAPDPGHGLDTYDVLTKLILTQTAFATSPSPARAGHRFAASLAAQENDTNGPIAKATIRCSASVAGQRLAATHSLTNGVASCYWQLPRRARGKTVRGTISVTLNGAKLARSFAIRVH